MNIPKLAALAALLAASTGRAAEPREVVVYASVDQAIAEPVFKGYEKRTGITVRAVFDTEETKSTGVLNRLIAEQAHPQADVFWSGDPVRPFLLVKRGLVEPYRSPAAADIPAAFKSAGGAWTGFAARARVLLVNTRKLTGGRHPTSIQDLADPRWKGQAAIASPLYGTTTMHVAALFAAWGDEKARAFLAGLKANEVRIASSNGEVKRLVAAGEVAFGLCDSDDAAEALAAGAPVALLYPDQDGAGTLSMPSSTVLIRGGPHAAEGRQLIDELCSRSVERSLAPSGYFPVRPDPHAAGPARVMTVDYEKIAAEVERIQPILREWAGY